MSAVALITGIPLLFSGLLLMWRCQQYWNCSPYAKILFVAGLVFTAGAAYIFAV